MMSGAMMGWMWLWPTLALAGLLTIAYVVVRLAQNSAAGSGTVAGTGTASSARRILDERFARGEIDYAEYQHRRGMLP